MKLKQPNHNVIAVMNGFVIRLGWTFSFNAAFVNFRHHNGNKNIIHVHLVPWWSLKRLLPFYKVGSFRVYFMTLKEISFTRSEMDALIVSAIELPKLLSIVVKQNNLQEHFEL